MSSLEKASKSPPLANSDQSSCSESKEPERWWHWGSKSPKHADHFRSFVLTRKRSRNKSRRFPEPELYSGEADADARKRMRPLESHYDHQIAKDETESDSGSDVRVSVPAPNESPRAKDEMSGEETTFENRKASSVAHINVKNETASSSEQSSAKKIKLLKRELELAGLHHDRKTLALEENIRYLQEENFAICDRLHWYKAQHEAKKDGSNSSNVVEELRAEVERKNIEIEEKIKQNSSLEEQLNTAEGLSAVLKDSWAGSNVSVKISEDLAELETAVSQAALLLRQCLSDKQFSRLRKHPCRKPGLDALIRSSLGKMSIISSEPKIAFSALLFGFVKERVCYSTCWTTLQRESYMLKGYQAVIERITPPGTLEGFQRAAFELMLEENNPFRTCWVQLQAEEAQSEFLELFSPLLEASRFESFHKDIHNALNRVFTKAFHFRARCVPPRGTRYELIQFRAGDTFEPRFMKAQRPDGGIFSVPIGEIHRVKVCLHGCLISHAFEERSLNGESSDTITQPFVVAKQSDKFTNNVARGVLKSGKALVILED